MERITGSPRTTRNPWVSDVRTDGRATSVAVGIPAAGSGRLAVAPERTSHSATAATANEAASMAKAAPTPMIATANPASAGPTVLTSCPVPCSIALAAARRAAGTRRGTSVLMAGRKTASTVPNRTPTSARCQTWIRAPITSPAMIVVRIARRTFDARARSRGDTRSESTPPSNMKTPRGMAAATRIAPSAKPEPVSPRTSHDRATMWNWSPSSDTLSPIQTNRKSRIASGATSGRRATRPNGRAIASGLVIRSRSARRHRRRPPRRSIP